MTDFSDRPLVAGVLRGVRSFCIDRAGMLTGVSQKIVWRVGENIARCYLDSREMLKIFGLVDGDDDHETATLECKCGFYAYFDGSNAYEGLDTITGIIEGYGRVVVGDRGFRSEKGRIVALVAPQDYSPLYRWTVNHQVYAEYGSIPLFASLPEAYEQFPLIPPPDWKPGPPSADKQLTQMMIVARNNIRLNAIIPTIAEAQKAMARLKQLGIAMQVVSYSPPQFVPDNSPPPVPEGSPQPQDHLPKGSEKQSPPFWAAAPPTPMWFNGA